jgi:hypothetical protein
MEEMTDMFLQCHVSTPQQESQFPVAPYQPFQVAPTQPRHFAPTQHWAQQNPFPIASVLPNAPLPAQQTQYQLAQVQPPDWQVQLYSQSTQRLQELRAQNQAEEEKMAQVVQRELQNAIDYNPPEAKEPRQYDAPWSALLSSELLQQMFATYMARGRCEFRVPALQSSVGVPQNAVKPPPSGKQTSVGASKKRWEKHIAQARKDWESIIEHAGRLIGNLFSARMEELYTEQLQQTQAVQAQMNRANILVAGQQIMEHQNYERERSLQGITMRLNNNSPHRRLEH